MVVPSPRARTIMARRRRELGVAAVLAVAFTVLAVLTTQPAVAAWDFRATSRSTPLGLHYLTDVLGGALLGTATALALTVLLTPTARNPRHIRPTSPRSR